MCVIHFNNGQADASIASGIDAGPFGYATAGATPDNGVLEIRNSSQRVAIVPADIVSWIDISN